MAIEDNSKVSPTSSELEDISKEATSLPSGDNASQKKGHFRRIVLADMKLKDWITLLIIPLILTTTGFLLNNLDKANSQLSSQQLALQQQQDSLETVIDQQHETTLQTYLNTIQDLLLNHHLGEPLNPNSSITIQEVRALARARTLVVLRGLDLERKGILVQFIYGAGLIIGPHPIIDLSGADLQIADLGGANLSGAYFTSAILDSAHLSYANLHGAYLSGANLRWAILRYANLSGAGLRNANLYVADLSHADLSGADLYGATLWGADLASANLVGADLTQQQLDQAYSCKYAILPTGLTCNKTS